MHLFIQKFYAEHFEPCDLKELKEDLAKLVISIVIKDDIYKVLICLQRIDSFEQDKDLRGKYSLLKGVKTTEFGIDPYLCLSDPIVVI